MAPGDQDSEISLTSDADEGVSGQLRTSSVSLARTSAGWTKATSAAGFVLRYLGAMRAQLIDLFSNYTDDEQAAAAADESLRRLLSHLVKAGFGEHGKGRLRDFLIRGIRSAAKMYVNSADGAGLSEVDFKRLSSVSPKWIGHWRDTMLERAWRSLERYEYSEPDSMVYSALMVSAQHPDSDDQQLAAVIQQETGHTIDSDRVQQTVSFARVLFAQQMADQIAETLSDATERSVWNEIVEIGLADVFPNLQPKGD